MRYQPLALAICLLATLQHKWSHSFVHARQDDSSAAISAFELLKHADKVIRPGLSQENAVLLVGNPGAGKTTIGKILTSNFTHLEAYYSDAHHQYLIRDQSNDNNETCQISSQLPEVMTDPENGVTFYKLPSYRISQCPNKTELGRVLLLRRLPKLTKSVKILLVADYNSLLFGSEEYFFNLVESALIMFPSLNFNNSIGLAATKVYSNETDTLIINRITKFLTGWRDELSPEATYDNRTERVVSLLASLLQDGKNGQPKIYFTRAPTRPGRLSDLDEMTEMRKKLADLVLRGLDSATYNTSDLNYELNGTDVEALESVYNEILKYIWRLERKFESFLTKLYSNEMNYLNYMTPQQIRLIYSSISAQELFPDRDEGSTVTKIPFWITAYIIDRKMKALDGVIIPLNSSFTAVRQELKDRENVLRAVYEILGTLPHHDTLKEILHPGDQATAAPFQPLLHFQRSFCTQLNTDPTDRCSSGQASEDASAYPGVLKRRCVLENVICRVLNEFVATTVGPATSNSSSDVFVNNTLGNATLGASGINFPLPHGVDSIFNFTASQMVSKLNAFSSEHTPNQLPPSKQIILHEFMMDLELVQIYQRFMNDTDKVPFVVMSNFLKSSIKVARNIFVPYNSSSSTGLPEQLKEQERALRLVHEVVGTLGDDDDGSEESGGQDEYDSASEALANLRSKFCRAFEADATGPVCDAFADHNGQVGTKAKQRCRASKVVCTILKELWQ